MKRVYIVITDNATAMQDYPNGIHSIWTSSRKANAERKKLNKEWREKRYSEDVWQVDVEVIRT